MVTKKTISKIEGRHSFRPRLKADLQCYCGSGICADVPFGLGGDTHIINCPRCESMYVLGLDNGVLRMVEAGVSRIGKTQHALRAVLEDMGINAQTLKLVREESVKGVLKKVVIKQTPESFDDFIDAFSDKLTEAHIELSEV